MSRNRARDRKSSNKLVSFAIVVFVVFIAVFLNMKEKEIKAGNATDEAKITELNEQIAEEKDRTEELEEYDKYTHTTKFYEEYARNVMGLCYPDEIIFKNED